MDPREREQGVEQEAAAPLVAEHGARKATEPTDPLELVETRVPQGDSEYLARCFIEEYAAIGFDGGQILALFRRPEYVAVHAYYRLRGEEAVVRLIADVLADCGVWRFSDASPQPSAPKTGPPPAPREPQKLVQIELPGGGPEEEQQR
jgi:hypothetical protein